MVMLCKFLSFLHVKLACFNYMVDISEHIFLRSIFPLPETKSKYCQIKIENDPFLLLDAIFYAM